MRYVRIRRLERARVIRAREVALESTEPPPRETTEQLALPLDAPILTPHGIQAGPATKPSLSAPAPSPPAPAAMVGDEPPPAHVSEERAGGEPAMPPQVGEPDDPDPEGLPPSARVVTNQAVLATCGVKVDLMRALRVLRPGGTTPDGATRKEIVQAIRDAHVTEAEWANYWSRPQVPPDLEA